MILTDASFDPKTKVAIIGFLSNNKITTKLVHNTTNTEAEFLAIIFAIETLDINKYEDEILYTDCKTAVDLIHKNRFTKPIYGPFLTLINKYNKLSLKHISGHKKRSEKTDIDILFSTLDKAVRQELRTFCNISTHSNANSSNSGSFDSQY
jgi:ribonuclease HI